MYTIDFNHIKHIDKTIPDPKIIYDDSKDYSGCYYRPKKKEILLGGVYHSMDDGIVVISSSCMDEEATINHEWRHHWQYWKGWKSDCIGWKCRGSYEESIVKFFKNSKTEMDALLFEYKHSKNDLNDYWVGLTHEV